jgi:hypothetical protein
LNERIVISIFGRAFQQHKSNPSEALQVFFIVQMKNEDLYYLVEKSLQSLLLCSNEDRRYSFPHYSRSVLFRCCARQRTYFRNMQAQSSQGPKF